jgi:hypothetical protein
MLSVYARHYRPCTQTGSNYRRCDCPKWINGTLPTGEFIRVACWKTRNDEWGKTRNDGTGTRRSYSQLKWAARH